MAAQKTAPYGSWKSPVTSDLIVSESLGFSNIALDGEDVYWAELRPSEKGRIVIVRYTPGAGAHDVTPPGYNARTRVHEYGGAPYFVDRGVVYFSNYADQRLYRQDPGGEPRPITPEVEMRYADGVVDRARGRAILVREDHTAQGREAVNTIVSLSLEGGDSSTVLVEGNDFYHSPRISPDGTQLAWLTWNHPHMPWDGNELWLGRFDEGGAVVDRRLVAGGGEEAIVQPEWGPDGSLYFVSDRTGWWNLYRLAGEKQAEALHPAEAEFGGPLWQFGSSWYAFEGPGRIVCIYVQGGVAHLGLLDTGTGKLETIDTPYTFLGGVKARAGKAYFFGGQPTEAMAVVEYDLKTRQAKALRRSHEARIDPAYISAPEPVEFPTEGGKSAYAFYYPPKNPDYVAPAGEKPPLIVRSHGGPTSAVFGVLDLAKQYWTSRGFAVVDVNYGGSTGYGTEYRRRLNDNWGVVDVDDCTNAARYLVKRGLVDPKRLAIAGGSAGGYTTLCALVFKDDFAAGASHFGIGDLETFVHDTHKFESRYLHTLVGPYPERKDLYHDRSAINFTDRLSCPVIFFQGLEDRVVPPSQAESMVAALRKKGLPVAYVPFEGEQHGFRQAANIKRSLDGELYFYGRVFGFEPADDIEPVEIENM